MSSSLPAAAPGGRVVGCLETSPPGVTARAAPLPGVVTTGGPPPPPVYPHRGRRSSLGGRRRRWRGPGRGGPR